MRALKRNKRKMYYALYSDNIEILDQNGNETGDSKSGYSAPVLFYASLSTGKSEAEKSPFGVSVKYDRIISTCDMNLPITETSVIWYKNEPTFNTDGSVNPASADYEVAAAPLDGLDSLLIAIRRRTTKANSTTETPSSGGSSE